MCQLVQVILKYWRNEKNIGVKTIKISFKNKTYFIFSYTIVILMKNKLLGVFNMSLWVFSHDGGCTVYRGNSA